MMSILRVDGQEVRVGAVPGSSFFRKASITWSGSILPRTTLYNALNRLTDLRRKAALR